MANALSRLMPVRHYRELHTWQLADELESEVARLMRSSSAARQDLRFRAQLEDASSGVPAHVAEGFSRCSPGDLCRFLDFALASLAETEVWLHSGIKRGYFEAVQCRKPLLLARRVRGAAVRLKRSQLRYIDQHGRSSSRKRPPPRP